MRTCSGTTRTTQARSLLPPESQTGEESMFSAFLRDCGDDSGRIWICPSRRELDCHEHIIIKSSVLSVLFALQVSVCIAHHRTAKLYSNVKLTTVALEIRTAAVPFAEVAAPRPERLKSFFSFGHGSGQQNGSQRC